MSSRKRVALLSNALGIGGTEKGLVSFARRIDRSAFRVSVIGVLDGGPRAGELEAEGIPVEIASGDRSRLGSLLEGVDIAHVFRAGTREPLVPAACRDAGVRVLVESNIFGQVDRSTDEHRFDAHLFMSQMCLMRYRERVGGGHDFDRRHKVLRFPIEHEDLRRAAPAKDEARLSLGLDPERPVVGRVGRAADLKWRDLLVDMVPHLLELEPEVQILFVGATEAKRRRLRELGLLERCTLVEPALDLRRLASFYAACDVFVSAAEIGESQGLGLGEALAFEVPVVTCSTPWVDNAQVEFVDQGRTGWFASHPASFAEAVADLLHDADRRARFGAEGRRFVEARLSGAPLTAQLERLYESLLAGRDAEGWEPSADELEAFIAAYPSRAAFEYRPLSAQERAQVRIQRSREYRRRTVTSLRGQGAGAVRDRVRGLRPVAGVRVSDRLSRLDPGGPAFRALHAGYLRGHRLAERFGLHVVRASYDSPIPVVHRLPEEVFGRVAEPRGLDWDPAKQVDFMRRTLAPYLEEFRPEPARSGPPGSFRLDNNTYDRVDAELLYAVLRHLRPARYVELGSGYSTLVAWEALERNRSEGHPADVEVYDPLPSPHVLARPELARLVKRTGAESLPDEVAGGLRASDVLFVDTSHTVKLGGDLNRIVLELLPLVAPGVVVHFHDIFLPRDYFRAHVDGAHYWTEQYLLQAFLSGNRDWEVLLGAQAVALEAPEVLAELIPSYHPGVEPGAFWIRRRVEGG